MVSLFGCATDPIKVPAKGENGFPVHSEQGKQNSLEGGELIGGGTQLGEKGKTRAGRGRMREKGARG
jgi:hypothetical protein